MKMERKQKYRAYVLLLVCMLIQIAAVFPHHHHSDYFCLHSDWEGCASATCSHELHHQHDGDRHSCSITCITHFQCSTPDLHSATFLPEYSFYTILYTLFDIFQLLPLVPTLVSYDEVGYIEKLHIHQAVRAIGLRAPPIV